MAAPSISSFAETTLPRIIDNDGCTRPVRPGCCCPLRKLEGKKRLGSTRGTREILPFGQGLKEPHRQIRCTWRWRWTWTWTWQRLTASNGEDETRRYRTFRGSNFKRTQYVFTFHRAYNDTALLPNSLLPCSRKKYLAH